MKTLLGIQLYKFSGEEVHKCFSPTHVDLPKYCLNQNGYIKNSEYDLQFVFEGKTPYYYLFNINSMDPILEEEISNAGLDELLKKINLRNIFYNLEPIYYEDFKKVVGVSHYLVIDLDYKCSNYPADDYDLNVNVIGYLDKEMNIIKI